MRILIALAGGALAVLIWFGIASPPVASLVVIAACLSHLSAERERREALRLALRYLAGLVSPDPRPSDAAGAPAPDALPRPEPAHD